MLRSTRPPASRPTIRTLFSLPSPLTYIDRRQSSMIVISFLPEKEEEEQEEEEKERIRSRSNQPLIIILTIREQKQT